VAVEIEERGNNCFTFGTGADVPHGFLKLVFGNIDCYFQATDLNLRGNSRQALRKSVVAQLGRYPARALMPVSYMQVADLRTRLLEHGLRRSSRPEGGIYPAWGVNPRWGESLGSTSPAGPASLAGSKLQSRCRPFGGLRGEGGWHVPGVDTPGWTNSALRAVRATNSETCV
jgi:hypothetical protein